MMPNGWKLRTIDDCIDFIGGSQPPKNTFVSENKEGYIRLIQIRDYKSDKYQTYIPKKLARKICAKNDVMIGRYGPPIFQILRGLEGAYNVALIKAIPKEGVELEYMYHFLKQKKLFCFIDGLSQRTSGQTGIEMDQLKAYPMPLPPYQQQLSISNILGVWESSIEKEKSLLANSEIQFKKLMHDLLFGQKRFNFYVNSNLTKLFYNKQVPSEWRIVTVEDIADEYVVKNSSLQNLPVVSCTKYNGFVDSLKYFNKQVFSDDTTGYKIIPHNYFGYPANHIEEGSIGLQNLYEAALVSPIYIIFSIIDDEISKDYLFYLFKTNLYQQVFSSKTNASVDRRGSLRWKEFKKIHVCIPTYDEQIKIVSLLKSVELQIEKRKRLIELLELEKHELMNQLLTGKHLVKVGDELCK